MMVSAFAVATAASAQAPTHATAPTLPSPDDALNARRDGTTPAFLKLIETSLRTELARPKRNDAAIVRLASLRAFAKRLADAKLPATGDAETLEWLVKHPSLGPLFLTALSDRDNPTRAIAALSAARSRLGAAVEQCPDLVVAACLVWDGPNREDQTPEQATRAGCDVLAHLIDNRRTMRLDLKALPWPVLAYLVDSRATPEDRRWAISGYRLPPEPGRAYFAIRYDEAGFASGRFRGGDDAKAYTLANILRLGGVCKDQAYFAAEVCRAAGIPAAVCTGQSGEGEGFHAWVGTLRVERNRAAWDFRSGRYPEHGLWSGAVVDPQTGEALTDGEVAMSAEWCFVPVDRRLLSLALTKSLDLVAEPPARLALAKAAIEAAPGNRQAWAALADQCVQPGTPLATLKDVSAVVERFAVGRYDDFAFKFFLALIGGRTTDEQLNLLDRASRFFPSRPDLLAELALRKGDVLRKAGRSDEALRLYEGVLEEALAYGPLALNAIGRVDAMLREAGKTRDLPPRYRHAWTRMAVPQASGYVSTTPWYVMGERYAKLLEETGDKPTAAKVLQTIRARDLSRPAK